LTVNGQPSSVILPLGGQQRLQPIRQFHYSVVIGFIGVFGAAGVQGYPGINIVMQGETMTSEFEFPIDGIEIIFFSNKIDLEIIAEDVRNLVKPFQTSVIVNNGLGAAKGNA